MRVAGKMSVGGRNAWDMAGVAGIFFWRVGREREWRVCGGERRGIGEGDVPICERPDATTIDASEVGEISGQQQRAVG